MKHVFQRGDEPLSAPAAYVLFRFGNPPDRSPGSTFSAQWNERIPKLIHTHQQVFENVPLVPRKEEGGVYSFSHPEFGMIHLVKRSWFEDRPKIWGERGVTMSFQGWSQGLWCDGVYARWQKARLTDLILPGGAFQVEWGRNSSPLKGVDEWSAEQKFFAQKMSLIEAVRSKFSGSFRGETELNLSGGSYEEVLTLLLLRLTFPRQKFSLLPTSKGQKRLAQNLNITPLRSPLKGATVVATEIDWGSSEAVQRLLEWQLRQSPFVPASLWGGLKAAF